MITIATNETIKSAVKDALERNIVGFEIGEDAEDEIRDIVAELLGKDIDDVYVYIDTDWKIEDEKDIAVTIDINGEESLSFNFKLIAEFKIE